MDEKERIELEKRGFVRIRPDRIKRLGITRVQVGGLWGKEKRARKDRDDR